jgi:phospholipid/cholesterol/gamma-HCH transport system ATP-binding protein
MGDPIISFSNVEKRFGDKVIYTGLDLEVFKGETLTVIGGSGVGKSVLLKLLIGLLRPEGGEIEAFGESVLSMSDQGLQALRRRIGMLFQGAALFDSLTVEQNICYPLIEHGWTDKALMTQRVEEVLEMVGMPGIQSLKPPELSGGMKKRVGLARAIAIEPDVILYDEPTTGLDPINVRRINGLILRLQEQLKVTSIVVTHDMESCFTVTDRVAFLNNKQIAWVGTREEAQAAKMPALVKFVQGGKGILDDDEMARKEGVL